MLYAFEVVNLTIDTKEAKRELVALSFKASSTESKTSHTSEFISDKIFTQWNLKYNIWAILPLII